MYYKFLNSIDSKEIGYHPQLKETWLKGVDYWAPNSFANTPIEGRIDFDIIFPKFELAKNGHLTDRLSTGCLTSDFFVVSEKLLSVLQAHKMDQYQQFPIEIGVPGGKAKYLILYFPFSRDNDFINWEDSVFIRELPSGVTTEEKFKSAREYNLARDSHQLLPDNLFFREGSMDDLDIFKFKWIEGATYVSEKLRQAMLDVEISGIRFESAEWLENAQRV